MKFTFNSFCALLLVAYVASAQDEINGVDLFDAERKAIGFFQNDLTGVEQAEIWLSEHGEIKKSVIDAFLYSVKLTAVETSYAKPNKDKTGELGDLAQELLKARVCIEKIDIALLNLIATIADLTVIARQQDNFDEHLCKYKIERLLELLSEWFQFIPLIGPPVVNGNVIGDKDPGIMKAADNEHIAYKKAIKMVQLVHNARVLVVALRKDRRFASLTADATANVYFPKELLLLMYADMDNDNLYSTLSLRLQAIKDASRLNTTASVWLRLRHGIGASRSDGVVIQDE